MPHNSSTRPATPASFNPFPGPMIYWPYPSPPISPTNYFNTLPGGVLPPHVNVNGHHSHSTPSLLTPTSSISSLSNGVTSPSPPVPPQGPAPSTLLTVENVNLQRGIDQRPTGEAVVAFPSLAEAERAISEKHRHNMGHRYIELFPA
jgi:epithelial splicing regulatory protein 1/2